MKGGSTTAGIFPRCRPPVKNEYSCGVQSQVAILFILDRVTLQGQTSTARF